MNCLSVGFLGITEQFVLTVELDISLYKAICCLQRYPIASIYPGMKLKKWDAATCRTLATTLVYTNYSGH